jgi:hypothetical protein
MYQNVSIQMLEIVRESDHVPTVYVIGRRVTSILFNALSHVPQVYEYVHHTKGTYLFLLLIFLLWLPSLPHLFIGSCLGPNLCSWCIRQNSATNPRKLKVTDFGLSQSHNIHAKFGHVVKHSCSCFLVFRETVHNSPSQHVMIMPAECRWHYIGYALPDLS